MSIADEVARLETENAQLRAALTQVVNAISGAADDLQGNAPAPKNETPVVTEVVTDLETGDVTTSVVTEAPEEGKVERKGVEGGAYRVNPQDVLGGRML